MVEQCNAKELNGKRYHCYFELTLNTIGGKWKPVILFHLAQEGILRFGELTRSIPDITQRMLTKQLRELEQDGLIHREVYRVVPPKVEYSLKAAGIKLIPILLQMRAWGLAYEKMQLGEIQEADGFESCGPPVIAEMYRDAV